jgi:hypothetical protein
MTSPICVCKGMNRSCPICQGSGYATCATCEGMRVVQVVGDDPNRLEWRACPDCGNMEAAPLPPMIRGMTPTMLTWTFSEMTRNYPALVSISNSAQQMVADRRGWLVMYSRPGRGKTYIMGATCNEAARSGMSVIYTLMSDMLNDLQESVVNRGDRTHLSLLREYQEVDLLAIDEFAEDRMTEWRKKVLRQVLVNRSDQVDWRPTLFATNWTGPQLEEHFPWLTSRFNVPAVVERDMAGVPDLRAVLTL